MFSVRKKTLNKPTIEQWWLTVPYPDLILNCSEHVIRAFTEFPCSSFNSLLDKLYKNNPVVLRIQQMRSTLNKFDRCPFFEHFSNVRFTLLIMKYLLS